MRMIRMKMKNKEEEEEMTDVQMPLERLGGLNIDTHYQVLRQDYRDSIQAPLRMLDESVYVLEAFLLWMMTTMKMTSVPCLYRLICRLQ